jgi:hypothetical protein
MLSSDLDADHDSLAMIKSVLHGQGDDEEKLKQLRELLSVNVIISSWISDPQKDKSPEAMIEALKERVEKFETNQHLREMEAPGSEI